MKCILKLQAAAAAVEGQGEVREGEVVVVVVKPSSSSDLQLIGPSNTHQLPGSSLASTSMPCSKQPLWIAAAAAAAAWSGLSSSRSKPNRILNSLIEIGRIGVPSKSN